jgi:hypothetical protein
MAGFGRQKRRGGGRSAAQLIAGKMGHMTDGDLLRDAVAELYSSDPEEFVERRGALVARARESGQAPAAKQIAALRKPTRSAWVVNKLVRADPGVTGELASLGEELRAAQDSLDGAAIRELSQRRRELMESLARRAFTVVGVPAPPAGIRDEVTATLGAALADPQFAGTLAAGSLVRAVQAEGFGQVGRPALTLVKGGQRGGEVGGGARAPRAKTAAPARPAAPSAEEVRAERERRHRAAVAEAEQAASEAAQAADAATAGEHELEATVERLEEELADAREALAGARVQARRARTRQRSTQQALDRLRGDASGRGC